MRVFRVGGFRVWGFRGYQRVLWRGGGGGVLGARALRTECWVGRVPVSCRVLYCITNNINTNVTIIITITSITIITIITIITVNFIITIL